jgi:hypothetical protein
MFFLPSAEAMTTVSPSVTRTTSFCTGARDEHDKGPDIKMVHNAADKKAAVYFLRYFMPITMEDETACSQVSNKRSQPETNNYELSVMD